MNPEDLIRHIKNNVEASMFEQIPQAQLQSCSKGACEALSAPQEINAPSVGGKGPSARGR